MKVKYSVFPASQHWDKALDDVSAAPSEVENVRLVAGARNIDALYMLSSLKTLWCFDVDAKSLSAISDCVQLEAIYLENVKTSDLSPLRKLRNMKILSLETCSKIESLTFLAEHRSLSSLAIIHFKNVHDLTPLAELESLRELVIAGSMWTRMQVDSFLPLKALTNLEFLHLTNIKAKDESLAPLHSLKKLKQLDIANFYPMSEFAILSSALSETNCAWLEPFFPIKYKNCKKCEGKTIVTLTGKRKPQLCENCDKKRLSKHVQDWRKFIAESV